MLEDIVKVIRVKMLYEKKQKKVNKNLNILQFYAV